MSRLLVLILSLPFLAACSARNYTYYLIEPAPQKHPALKEEGTLTRPLGFGSTTVMKVRWNDGNLITEVDVPVLATGQRIVIEHGAGSPDVKTIPATRVVPPPPTQADASLVEAYRARGLRIDESAPEVSITRARSLMQQAVKEGNYPLALEWCETVLQRYKSHPEFLRAKASLLLMMGERDKAIEIYEQVEAIESDPEVRKKLEELQRQRK
ncbi:tetratricopeptide repeat protein [Hyalangium versicolor]|uniref:tetratricopeptide repeat protein n=1 Tax=Hyalangium versicolor TaxID=2861190 RepID=UPI001CCB9D93|nr:tetratricopeptide repeat protein [Hyalangium versicolor]